MAESTLITKLNQIKDCKEAIMASLNNKLNLGITNSTLFSEYASKIDTIEMAPYTADGTQVKAGTFGKTANALSTGNTMYYNGDFQAFRVMNAVWNDYAEFFEADGEWTYGDIIELNPETGKYRRAQSEDSTLVVGVASNTYGSIVGGEECSIDENLKKYIPIGLMGRVKVKIKGPIQVGDLISTSDEPGVGKKSDGKVGTIIGKALVSSDFPYNMIPMLILRG